MSSSEYKQWTRDELLLIVEKWLDIDGDRDRLVGAASELQQDFHRYSTSSSKASVNQHSTWRLLRLLRTMSNITGTGKYGIGTRRWYADFFRREFYGNEELLRLEVGKLREKLSYPPAALPVSASPPISPKRKDISGPSFPRMIRQGGYQAPNRRSDEYFVGSVLKALVLRSDTITIGPSLKEELQKSKASFLVEGKFGRRALLSYARIRLGLFEAIQSGDLRFQDSDWHIRIDVEDGTLSLGFISDAFRMVSHFCGLYGIELKATLHADIRSRLKTNLSRMESLSTKVVPADAGRIPDVTIHVTDDPVRATGLSKAKIVPFAGKTHAIDPWNAWPAPRPISISDRTTEHIRFFLREVFGFRDFRGEQYAILERALLRKDVVGLLPTGGGKSLTFQLAGLLSPGTTIVISPLVALISDQVDNLRRKGIDAVVGMHSSAGGDRTFTPNMRFLYISPERLHIASFRNQLATWMENGLISHIVVDEAHCVSEWGHDFRTSYLGVVSVLRTLLKDHQKKIPINALTGTASNSVLIDIQRELEISSDEDEAVVSSSSFDRPNLHFIPIHQHMASKRNGLDLAMNMISRSLETTSTALFDDPQTAGLVFCTYAGGPFGVVELRNYLIDRHAAVGHRIDIFSGKCPSNSGMTNTEWAKHKERVQREFKNNELSALVSTKSFGMGIDKPNIRYTIHFGMPPSLEAFAQEAGRSGRDGKDSYCALIFSDETNQIANEIFSSSTSEQRARQLIKEVRNSELADASRYFRYLMSRSYPGVEKEVIASLQLLNQIRLRLSQHTASEYPLLVDIEGCDDKAVFRMKVLGVIDDYLTTGISGKKFTLRIPDNPSFTSMKANLASYIERYDSPARSTAVARSLGSPRTTEKGDEAVVRALITFSYEVIEGARRQAIGNSLDVMRRSGTSGTILAKEIAEYLDHNVFTGRLSKISLELDFGDWWQVLDEIETGPMGVRLAASARRELENNPFHPGVHIIAAVGETWRSSPDYSNIANHLSAALNGLEERYAVRGPDAEALVEEALRRTRSNLGGKLEPILTELCQRQEWRMLLIAESLVTRASERQYVEIAGFALMNSIAISIMEMEGIPA